MLVVVALGLRARTSAYVFMTSTKFRQLTAIKLSAFERTTPASGQCVLLIYLYVIGI